MKLEQLQNLAISDSGFIFDPSTGNSFTTNETGIFIISQLKKGKKSPDIAAALQEEYSVDQQTAEHDVYEIIELLQSHNLI